MGDADKRNRWTVREIKLVSSPLTSPVGVCDDGLSGKVLGCPPRALGGWQPVLGAAMPRGQRKVPGREEE